MMRPAVKTGFNDHRKYDYVELSGIVESAKKPLSENGLSFVQIFKTNKNQQQELQTILMHESGQSIDSTLTLLGTPDYHALGSACTYSRKYALASILGIVAEGEDDDGEGAMKPKEQTSRTSAGAKSRPRKTNLKKLPSDPWVNAIAIIDKVEGARTMFESKDIDVREMIPQVVEKINQMGEDGMIEKVAEWKKEIEKEEKKQKDEKEEDEK